MKNKIRKITAICLVSTVIISSLVFAKATDNEIAPSKDLLEAILNDRTWVLDTLLEGDYSTNPCEYLANTPNFKAYSQDVYDRFVSDKKLAALIRVADVIYNAGGYIADALVNEPLATLQELALYYGVEIPEENKEDVDYIVTALTNVLGSFNKTREEKYYEYILNGIFTADFSSPAQITVEQEEATIAELQTLSEQYDDIEGIIKDQKDLVKFGTSVTENIKYNYINDILPLYSYSVNEYLDSYSIVGNTMAYTQDMIDENRNSFTDSLYTMSMLQKYDSNDESVKVWRSHIQGENLLKKTNNILKPAGETVAFVNSALNNYVLVESLQSQRETTVGALDSLYNISTNVKLRNAVATYRNLINDEYDGLTFLYKTGVDTITDGNLIYDTASKFVTKKITNLILNHASVSTVKLVSKAASVLAAVNITSFLTDVVTGVEETVKKVYQIEHALKMIDYMKAAYEEDLSIYLDDKTEENAQAVLNDLMFLRKIRMFTCKLAHDSAVNQLDSWLGKLLTGNDETLVEDWDYGYEEQIEVLLSASINPISKTPFTLNEGDSMVIYADKNYAVCKLGGLTYYLVEPAERMMSGLIINGGELTIVDFPEANRKFYISSITSTGNSTIKLYENVNLDVYGLYQESGTLTLDLGGDIRIKKSFDSSKSTINTVGNGEIIFEGDVKLVNSSISKVRLESDSEQSFHVSGTSIKDLILNNESKEGVTVTGTVNVTNSVQNSNTRTVGGKNIVLKQGGNIVGNYIHDDISVENFNYNRNIVFGNGLFVIGTMNITTDYSEINSELSSIGTATLNVSSNSHINVRGDTYFKSSCLNIDGTFESGGEIILEGTHSTYFNKLILNGASAQSIKTSTAVSVEDLINLNNTSSGVSVSGIWNINQSIESSTAKFTNGTNLVLQNDAVIVNGKLKSDISVNNWTSDYNLDIVGSMKISGETSFLSGTIDIGGTLTNQGTLQISDGVELNIDGVLKQSSGTIVANTNTGINVKAEYISSNSTLSSEGNINVEGDTQITNSTFESDGEATFHGDFTASTFTGYFNKLNFSSFIPQNYSCNTALIVNNLTITNLSVGGITIGNTINVADTFENKSLRIVNREKIVCGTYVSETTDGVMTIEGNFYLSQWNGESNIHVSGNVIVNEDRVIPCDKTLTVDGDLKITSGNLTIEEGATIDIGTNLIGTGGTISLNGSMSVSEDISLKSVTLTGDGNLTLCGDLYAQSSSISKPNAVFRSKAPQAITGSQICFNNITFENTSASGVCSASTVYYYGNMTNEYDYTMIDTNKFVYKEEA